ncbi:MAG: LPXTG cell wall anchor domain-containing protein [Bacteroidota bacterium]
MKYVHSKVMVLVLLLAVILFSTDALAQPFTLDDNIKPVKLELLAFEDDSLNIGKGKINMTEVTQVNDTLYFSVYGVSIYSPIYVGINATDPDKPLDISLHKMNWINADRKGKTDANGEWEDSFKTETDFGIRVISKADSTNYGLIVWAGDEADLDLPQLFDPEPQEEGGLLELLKENILYIIIGILLLIILYFFMKNKKKKA